MQLTITLDTEEIPAEIISELILEIDKAIKESTIKSRAEQSKIIQEQFKDFRQKTQKRAYCVR